MKNTVIIAPNLKAHSDMVLQTSYNIGNKFRYLADMNTFVEIDQAVLKAQKFDHGGMGAITFNNNVRELKYEYETILGDDEKMKPASEADKEILRTVEVFWKQHPLMLVNSKEHFVGSKKTTMQPLYNLVDKLKKDAESINSFDTKFKIAAMIREMSFDSKCDVAFYYGVSPVGMGNGQLLVKLADFATGICMSDEVAATFLSVWSVENKAREYRINARKALERGLIVNMPKDNKNNYYHGTAFIGTTQNDIEEYFKRDTRMYEEHIVRELAKDTMEKEKAESAYMDSVAAGTISENRSVHEIEEARKAVFLLKQEGFVAKVFNHTSCPVPKLFAELESAQARKKEAQEKQAATA
jgi:hypothetical protein